MLLAHYALLLYFAGSLGLTAISFLPPFLCSHADASLAGGPRTQAKVTADLLKLMVEIAKTGGILVAEGTVVTRSYRIFYQEWRVLFYKAGLVISGGTPNETAIALLGSKGLRSFLSYTAPEFGRKKLKKLTDAKRSYRDRYGYDEKASKNQWLVSALGGMILLVKGMSIPGELAVCVLVLS